MGTSRRTQFELYRHLYALGVGVIPEYTLLTPDGRRVYLDLAIVTGKPPRLLLIVEVKSRSGYAHPTSMRKRRWEEGKQAQKYRSLGVPVLYVNGNMDMAEVAMRIAAYVRQGVSLLGEMSTDDQPSLSTEGFDL